MSLIHEAAGQEANIIFGTVKDDQMLDEISVTVIATGFNLSSESRLAAPAAQRDNQIAVPAEKEAPGVKKIENLNVPAHTRRRTAETGRIHATRTQDRTESRDAHPRQD